MTKDEIRIFLESFSAEKRARTIVIVDFANVDKWQASLGWPVGIQELARLVKHFSFGSKALRRFYYGSDYGPREKSLTLTFWSKAMLDRAGYNNFEVITKRVKYIHTQNQDEGQKYNKKCDFDVEMAVDLIKLKDQYDTVVIFSGDGDLVCALQYLSDFQAKKEFYVFGARNHIGKEVIDAKASGLIQDIFYAEDFEYRLSPNHGRGGGAHATVRHPYRS